MSPWLLVVPAPRAKQPASQTTNNKQTNKHHAQAQERRGRTCTSTRCQTCTCQCMPHLLPTNNHHTNYTTAMKLSIREEVFIEAAQPMLRHRVESLESVTAKRRWMACFGARPIVMADVWCRVSPETTMPEGVHPKHLVWMFYFIKLYNQEELNASNVGGVDEKTFRKWVWLFIEATSFLEYPVVCNDSAHLVLFLLYLLTFFLC